MSDLVVQMELEDQLSSLESSHERDVERTQDEHEQQVKLLSNLKLAADTQRIRDRRQMVSSLWSLFAGNSLLL